MPESVASSKFTTFCLAAGSRLKYACTLFNLATCLSLTAATASRFAWSSDPETAQGGFGKLAVVDVFPPLLSHEPEEDAGADQQDLEADLDE